MRTALAMAEPEPTPELVEEVESAFRCPDCGFAYPMAWYEEAVNVNPPAWYSLPLYTWQPQAFLTQQTLCTRCGRATVSDMSL